MIKLENIYKYYGKTKHPALSNINLNIEKGEMISIMGPSGSGKSTLLKLIGLIDSPSEGNYFIDGVDTLTSKKQYHKYRNELIGFIFQNFSLLDDYSVLDNVMLPLIYRGVKPKLRNSKALEMLELVGLKDHIKKYPTELSGGEQQRVAIARVLTQDPSIILADEPTGALDQKNGENIMNILKDINKQDKTILVVTHDKNIAAYCNRSIDLLDGIII